MQFGHIELFASDTQRSRHFYENVLDFEVTAVQGQNVWLQKDNIEILLRPGQPPPPAARYQDAPSGLVLYTDDLPGTMAELRGRGLEFKGTVDSDKCHTFTDPDGNWFQLVDPGDP
jgi:catechol 2,3-dioxygenase-like lactoylglutathione lyase family enzyme